MDVCRWNGIKDLKDCKGDRDCEGRAHAKEYECKRDSREKSEREHKERMVDYCRGNGRDKDCKSIDKNDFMGSNPTFIEHLSSKDKNRTRVRENPKVSDSTMAIYKDIAHECIKVCAMTYKPSLLYMSGGNADMVMKSCMNTCMSQKVKPRRYNSLEIDNLFRVCKWASYPGMSDEQIIEHCSKEIIKKMEKRNDEVENYKDYSNYTDERGMIKENNLKDYIRDNGLNKEICDKKLNYAIDASDFD